MKKALKHLGKHAMKNLAEVLQQIAEWCDIGWEIYLDIANQQWVFDVMQGRDLTAGQNLLPPVIFSPEFENVEGMTYIDSSIPLKMLDMLVVKEKKKGSSRSERQGLR